MQDDLGDRMKEYEKAFTSKKVDYLKKVIYARIDGRGFSKFTKGMKKPFDPMMTDCMVETTKRLVHLTHATAGFVQSDEISLFWDLRSSAPKPPSMMFDGKIQKLTSVLSGIATITFYKMLLEWTSSHDEDASRYLAKDPHFDARIFELPDEHELANAFLWRYKDCVRNAVSMIGQSKYSHKFLQGKSTIDIRVELENDNINIEEDYPMSGLHGTFVRRRLDRVGSGDAAVWRSVIYSESVEFSKLEHKNRVNYMYGE